MITRRPLNTGIFSALSKTSGRGEIQIHNPLIDSNWNKQETKTVKYLKDGDRGYDN